MATFVLELNGNDLGGFPLGGLPLEVSGAAVRQRIGWDGGWRLNTVRWRLATITPTRTVVASNETHALPIGEWVAMHDLHRYRRVVEAPPQYGDTAQVAADTRVWPGGRCMQGPEYEHEEVADLDEKLGPVIDGIYGDLEGGAAIMDALVARVVALEGELCRQVAAMSASKTEVNARLDVTRSAGWLDRVETRLKELERRLDNSVSCGGGG
jgi:hypothetical protein